MAPPLISEPSRPEDGWFAVLDDHRVLEVRGADANGWLHDLLTCDVEGLEAGRARHGLFLSPTGRIRADLWVARDRGRWWLVQGPSGIAARTLLAPFVLSADVELAPRPETVPVAVAPAEDTGSADPEGTIASWRPTLLSPIAPDGHDLLVPREATGRVAAALSAMGRTRVDRTVLERWRITAGIPRFGVDLDEDTAPAEVGWDGAIDTTKGCFPGQEAVAKIRNLGHPPTVLLHLTSPSPVSPGEPVALAEGGSHGEPVGRVTSATAAPDGGSIALARVRWASHEASLAASDGVPLSPVRRPG
jgi:folate-binding protein YgfZ